MIPPADSNTMSIRYWIKNEFEYSYSHSQWRKFKMNLQNLPIKFDFYQIKLVSIQMNLRESYIESNTFSCTNQIISNTITNAIITKSNLNITCNNIIWEFFNGSISIKNELYTPDNDDRCKLTVLPNKGCLRNNTISYGGSLSIYVKPLKTMTLPSMKTSTSSITSTSEDAYKYSVEPVYVKIYNTNTNNNNNNNISNTTAINNNNDNISMGPKLVSARFSSSGEHPVQPVIPVVILNIPSYITIENELEDELEDILEVEVEDDNTGIFIDATSSHGNCGYKWKKVQWYVSSSRDSDRDSNNSSNSNNSMGNVTDAMIISNLQSILNTKIDISNPIFLPFSLFYERSNETTSTASTSNSTSTSTSTLPIDATTTTSTVAGVVHTACLPSISIIDSHIVSNSSISVYIKPGPIIAVISGGNIRTVAYNTRTEIDARKSYDTNKKHTSINDFEFIWDCMIISYEYYGISCRDMLQYDNNILGCVYISPYTLHTNNRYNVTVTILSKDSSSEESSSENPPMNIRFGQASMILIATASSYTNTKELVINNNNKHNNYHGENSFFSSSSSSSSQSYADMIIYIHSPPIGGIFNIYPPEGLAMRTSFNFNSNNWILNSNDQYPITFQYFYKISPESTLLALSNAREISYMRNILLPVGLSSNNDIVYGVVYVCDNMRICTDSTTEVIVHNSIVYTSSTTSRNSDGSNHRKTEYDSTSGSSGSRSRSSSNGVSQFEVNKFLTILSK
eukprot:gene4403-8762_t